MKKNPPIFIFLLLGLSGQAQVNFKTLIPPEPVVSGESFQVQYIIEDGEKTMSVYPPAFNNFRFVAGPNIYMGSVSTLNGLKPLRNAVYTLEAKRPGKFIIPGATVIINGKVIRSNDVLVEVISKEEAIKRFNKENDITPSDYFLKPGENAYEKIRQNLFVKVMVDKRTCFVGEPVLATFKLYSRLESKSDIVKNPGFYGFTVYDMVNLADKQVAIEYVKGKTFDVHTIRKVQLYPLQAGIFTVDAMEIKNRVEFSRSAVNKKTEQEIVEGGLKKNESELPAEGTAVYETDISTAPVTINVKRVPEKNKPSAFNGATGNFTISSFVVKNKLRKNEEGFFEIRISGKGNFTQLSAPSVQWPAGIEGFEPMVKDIFDKTQVPLAGSRTFRFPFISSTPGVYTIPPINFSFFNTDSGRYKTVDAPAVQVSISNEEKAVNTVLVEKDVKKRNPRNVYWILAASILALYSIGLYLLIRKRKPRQEVVIKEVVKPTLSVDEILSPVYDRLLADDKNFYAGLQQAIWKFFKHHFNLSGSEIKKDVLALKLKDKGINTRVVKELQNILEECEVSMFTKASLGGDKSELLQRTRLLMEETNNSLL